MRLLSKLHHLGIILKAQNGELNIHAPKNVLTPELIKEIKENKAGLLNLLSSHTPIPRASLTDDYPLSNAQRRLWVLSKFDGASRAYHIQARLKLTGKLETIHFQTAVSYLLSRHEILRTGIIEKDGQVFQHIYKPEAVSNPVKIMDVSKQQKAAIAAVAAGFYDKDFDLSKPPLFKILLLSQGADRWELLFSMHHIISDGWSVSVFLKELSHVYNSCLADTKPTLPPLNIHYGDYSVWMEKNLKDKQWNNKYRKYWSTVFDILPEPLELPSDHLRPKVKDYSGGRISHLFSKQEQGHVEQLCTLYNLTPNMALLMVLSVLLYRYSRHEDIVIGSPVSGRDHGDLSGQLGFYVNTLPLRIRLSAKDTVATLSEKIRKVVTEALEHQMYPYDLLIEDLPLKRNTSRTPLYDIILDYQPNVEGNINMQGVEMAISKTTHISSKFDLSFMFSETSKGLELSLDYWDSIFKQERIIQMLKHFRVLLKNMVTDKHAGIDSLNILTKVEKQKLFNFSEGPEIAYPADKTITDLFRAQAAKNPDATAVVFEQKTLSYKSLDQLSDKLAYILVTKTKTRKDKTVALLLSKSERMIIAILGVLKSGAAYVPVDPQYPKARKAYMLNDCKPACVIGEKNNDADIPGELPVILLSENFDTLTLKTKDEDKIKINPDTISVNKALLPQNTDPGDLAYVMYTSGSTGKPKGVMIEHRGVVRLTVNVKYMSFSSHNRLLQAGALSFDAATFEVWGILLNGGRLHLLAQDSSVDIDKLKASIERNEINTMWFTSSWFNQLADEDIGIFKGLKQILVGGEQLSPIHINKVYAHYPGIKIVNGYGPTENTTLSTSFQVDGTYEAIIPIGSPISNSSAYILDDCHNLLPVGFVGELYLGGAGLARGYLNNEALTRKMFIPHPFKKGERLYKAGDMARWLPNGNIEFLGRKDGQLKVRGFRIETGEIVSLLNQHRDVKDSVLTGHKINGFTELVAYVIPEKEKLDKRALKAYLDQHLPSYMIPSRWLEMDAFPLTANGKLNKKALPDPLDAAVDSATYTAAENETEQALVQIWEEVLGIENIGVHDNFFETGGNSLLSISLRSKIQNLLGREISIVDIYQYPTIKSFANHISGEIERNTLVSRNRLRAKKRKDILSGGH